MKKLLFSALLFAGFCSLNSCAKCLTCKNSIEKYKICTKDSDDSDDFNDQLRSAESNGYKCHQSAEAL